MSIEKLPTLNLQLPLRFDSGTFAGSIVDAGNVTLAHNVHANIGPELVLACNSFASLSARNEAMRAEMQNIRELLTESYPARDADIAACLDRALLAQSRGEGV
jgi:hypothetical protein